MTKAKQHVKRHAQSVTDEPPLNRVPLLKDLVNLKRPMPSPGGQVGDGQPSEVPHVSGGRAAIGELSGGVFGFPSLSFSDGAQEQYRPGLDIGVGGCGAFPPVWPVLGRQIGQSTIPPVQPPQRASWGDKLTLARQRQSRISG
jgi:hypothetical protein